MLRVGRARWARRSTPASARRPLRGGGCRSSAPRRRTRRSSPGTPSAASEDGAGSVDVVGAGGRPRRRPTPPATLRRCRPTATVGAPRRGAEPAVAPAVAVVVRCRRLAVGGRRCRRQRRCSTGSVLEHRRDADDGGDEGDGDADGDRLDLALGAAQAPATARTRAPSGPTSSFTAPVPPARRCGRSCGRRCRGSWR